MDRKDEDQSDAKKSGGEHSTDYAPYPKIDPKDVDPVVVTLNQENSGSSSTIGSQKSGDSKESTVIPENQPTTMPSESNPYISASPAQSPHLSVKDTVGSVRDALERWGKKMGEATKKAEDLAGNVWQHLKTAPSVTDAAMGRIAQSTKVLAEGGYEKIFQQTFETVPGEQLQNSYACYLSTSAGPIMGILYVSTAKVAFGSDNPLSYKVGDQTEWSYYKVVIPLHQLKAVNPSASRANPAEKYIQAISVDNHEFWFMGFVNYDSAVKHLQEASRSANLHSA